MPWVQSGIGTPVLSFPGAGVGAAPPSAAPRSANRTKLKTWFILHLSNQQPKQRLPNAYSTPKSIQYFSDDFAVSCPGAGDGGL